MRINNWIYIAVLLAGCSKVTTTQDANLVEEFCKAAPPSTRDVSAADMAKASNAFAWSLYSQGRQSPDNANVFLSAYSVGAALGMLRAGAKGETAAQIATALHWTVPGADYDQSESAFTHDMICGAVKQGYTFSVANAAWVQQGMSLLPGYTGLLTADYLAKATSLDFVSDTEGARQTIDRWVSGQTRGRIPELLKKGDIDGSTQLVLTNAMYFLADWDTPFDANETAEASFRVDASTSVTVPMMSRRATLQYAARSTFGALELPYKNGAMSMVIALPHDPDGVGAVEDALSADPLGTWASGLPPTDVILTLPKFEYTARFYLTGALEALGITDAFSSSRADLSGLFGSPGLFVSNVIHQAFVKVDEKGTEAAAATSISVVGAAAPSPDQVYFRADHPFVFLIRDNATGAILFMGRVNDPSRK